MRRPPSLGLYEPFYEHDACGVGLVANLTGKATHTIVRQGIQVLENLEHRGASGCDPETGDGAGILVQTPDAFFRKQAEALKFSLPDPGRYAVAMVFLPHDEADRAECMAAFELCVEREGLRFLAWRDTPRDVDAIGEIARRGAPVIFQAFVACDADSPDVDAFERKLYVLRKSIEKRIRATEIASKDQFYIPSMSARTLVYKGLMLAPQMARFYPDLQDPAFASAFALVHQRYSTNTMPSWPLAQPFRFLCHNGEINTLRGNLNMMRSRERDLASPLFGEDIRKLIPIHDPGASDSACLDNTVELLVRGGRSLAHSMMMLIPEPWSGHESMPDDKRAFYEFHACMQEPWDGPASIAFTDGIQIGAVLDRNGLRPSRYWVTKDDFVVMASEAGVLDIPQTDIVRKGRLRPGNMFLLDIEEHRIIDDEEIKEDLCRRSPYRRWINANRHGVPSAFTKQPRTQREMVTLLERQQLFGYTMEDLDVLIQPMAEKGQEPVGSMGNDTPLAVLSRRPQLLYNYFKQLFAQVTNPPIDPIREAIVMSLETDIGRERNLLDESPQHARKVHLKSPLLTNEQLVHIWKIGGRDFTAATISCLFPVSEGPKGLVAAIDRICREASEAVRRGVTFLVLSDRAVNASMAPVPMLLAVGAAHQHLVRERTRTNCDLIVETGEAREVMHFCLLTGYGAGAVNPYLALESIEDMVASGKIVEATPGEAQRNYLHAIEKGLLKTMSKIGISTQHSYRGAQIFEALGLSPALVDQCFTGTASRIGGIDAEDVARETLLRHAVAYPKTRVRPRELDPGGAYKWRRRGEFHQVNPDTIAKLQHASRKNSREAYREFAQCVNDRNRNLSTLRGLMKFRPGDPVPIDEVEPAAEIVKRFCTGAMSFGSISREAHETLAVAMNRIGGRSNTGEGGEDPKRFEPDPDGNLRRSAIKQVASGRFGVTNEYLVNADELQIKMAQGAKPGEGGQLPGHKVFDEIAKVRYSTPGVELISPPPHHDIYSIEDLAQLIHDLKNANVQANVSVKLVSEVGVGTVAAGVSKGKADLVLISGDSGGTGASPLSSIKHAGLPWELGLTEAHQVLVANNLRSRIRVQTDGQLKTGRDVAIAFLLGADEVGFATAPLIASGCIMMRKCHLNTCPVGIATQDPELRKKFSGKPEYVVNYFFFIAEELREIMAELGFRTVNEMIGRADMLEYDPLPDHWKARKVDLSRILYKAEPWDGETCYHSRKQDHGLDRALDRELIAQAKPVFDAPSRDAVKPIRFKMGIRNVNRTVGAMLSSELTRRFRLGMYTGSLPHDTVWIDCEGAGGQSFGAFIIQGVTVSVTGEVNDYCGKGLSGGKIIVRPPEGAPIIPEENIIVGNVALYGATGGEAYFRGAAGERFCVRNSGAWAVVEGVGDHGCEYMTGGRAAILGPTGRNFAAGMSGGIAYVYDADGGFKARCNHGLVDLEPVAPERLEELRGMIERHLTYTDSAVARRILDAWPEESRRFVCVMPRDYARALREAEAAESDAQQHTREVEHAAR